MNLSQLKGIAALIWFDGLLPIRRSPFSAVNFVVSPLTILFFIYIFGGVSSIKYGITGGLVAVIVGSCIILETEAAFIRLVVRLQDMFVSSPLSPVTYVVSLSVAQLFNGLLGIILFSVLIVLEGSITFIGGAEIALASVLTWASVSALGFLLSTFARDMRDLWVYSPLLNVLLSFLPPVFYKITIIPESFRFVAYLAPTTYPAQIIQTATGIIPGGATDIAFYFAGGIVYTLILVALSAKFSRWRQR
ncbi:MAG: ABC transporter permease [Nitrososphaerales archaeon]